MRPAFKIPLLNTQVHVRAILLLLAHYIAIGLLSNSMNRLMVAGDHVCKCDQCYKQRDKREQYKKPCDVGVTVLTQGA